MKKKEISVVTIINMEIELFNKYGVKMRVRNYFCDGPPDPYFIFEHEPSEEVIAFVRKYFSNEGGLVMFLDHGKTFIVYEKLGDYVMSSISFTGHRKLPEDISALTQRLYDRLEEEIQNGATDFNTGGAVGFDSEAASVVLKLREIYPYIKLHLILPCSNEEQTEKWSDAEKAEFNRILNLADSVEYTSEHHYDGCMKKRNARLVELADCCYCYWDGRQRSGTGQTVRMAIKKNIMIVNLYENQSTRK